MAEAKKSRSNRAASTPAPKHAHRAVWADIESTGLAGKNPGDLYGDGQILEIALAVIKDSPRGSLKIEKSIVMVLRYKINKGPDLHPAVIKMHTDNGLFAECRKSKLSLKKADRTLLAWLQDVTGKGKPTGIKLAGNSVHFDREWIREQLPKFAACLHHRVFDVTSLQEFGEAFIPGFEVFRESAHRAIPDVEMSIEALRRFRKAVRG